MKIALIGATGFVGAAVLAEALQRGHQVTALARTPAKLASQPGLRVVQADVLDAAQVADAVTGQEAVISAYNPGWTNPALHDEFLRGGQAILAGVKRAGVKRVLMVGGAASLYVAPGVQLFDTPQFRDHVPANIIPGAKAALEMLNRIRGEDTLDWTFISPPVGLAPGARSGHYQVGGDEVPMKDGAPAGISVADLAAAIVDEIEVPRQVKKRFTVWS